MKRFLAMLLAMVLVLALLPAAQAAENDFSVCLSTTLNEASSAQISNIRRAIAKISGTRLPTGASFSFNTIVGPRTKAYGFQNAPNGRGANVTGGGVAQAATTLYLTLREYGADVTYDELKFYGSKFTGNYANPSDAVLVDHASDIDFAFTNLGGDMEIQMWIADGELYCGLTIAQTEWNAFEWNSFAEERTPIAQASFTLGSDSAMLNNIRLAAGSINDTSLPSGSVFSFNDTVGPRTASCGYRSALNGRGVNVTGGGVAQVASVIWLAIRNCEDTAIVEKATYGSRYNQNYVQSSNDAILVDYKSGRDFSFRNTGSEPLTLCTYIQGNELICEIYRG